MPRDSLNLDPLGTFIYLPWEYILLKQKQSQGIIIVLKHFFKFFFIDFDGYYIVKTDEGQPRPKYIFNKCGTNIYFFTLQRFGPSPSLNFKYPYSL